MREQARGTKAEWKFLRDNFLAQHTCHDRRHASPVCRSHRQHGFAGVDLKDRAAGGLELRWHHGAGTGLADSASANKDNLQLCKAVLCAGLYPNVVKVQGVSTSGGGEGRGGGGG